MNTTILISVIDGQGGGIGRQLVERLTRSLSGRPQVTIRALGTNALATSNMIKAGAHDGATGENAIILNAKKSDIIVGVMPIVMPHAILGEITPAMAEAIGACDALKVLIPLQRCGTILAMTEQATLQQYIEKAEEIIMEQLSARL